MSVWSGLDCASLLELRTEFGSLHGNDYLKYLPVVLIDCLAREVIPEELDYLVLLLDGNDHYDPNTDRAIAKLLGGRLPYTRKASRERTERVCQERLKRLALLDPLQSEAVLCWLEYFRRYAGESLCEGKCEEAIQYWSKRVRQGRARPTDAGRGQIPAPCAPVITTDSATACSCGVKEKTPES